MPEAWNTAAIEKLEPRERRYVVALGMGLVLRVCPGGSKTWGMRTMSAGRAEAATLGSWPEMSLAAALKAAKSARTQMRAEGCSLRKCREQASKGAREQGAKPTLRAFSARYLTEIASKKRKDLKPVQRWLDVDVLPALGSHVMAEITVDQARDLVFAKRDAGSPAAAGAIRDLLHRIFAYAKVCRIRDDNPLEAVPAAFVYEAKSRERALHAAELKTFFAGLRSPKLGQKAALALELLLLTLTRKSELRLCQASEVNLETGVWEIPAEKSKTHRAHTVYLSGRAGEIFRALGVERMAPEACVLPTPNSATQPVSANWLNRAVLRVKWGMPKFTPHDLRRTAATLLNEMDYDDDWIETALNHSRKGIRGVYNKARYAKQRRQMLEEWAAYLAKQRA